MGFRVLTNTYFHKLMWQEINLPKGVGRQVKQPYLEHLHPHDGKHEL